MKKLILLSFLLLALTNGHAQPQTPAQCHESAKAYMRQGDYANAILLLQRCQELDPGNIAYSKDIALSHFFRKDNRQALETIKPLLDHADADDQCYQIAGYVYKDMGEAKECEKLFRKGLKRFPKSGALYSDLGELLMARQDYEAIELWEKGIEQDPSYARNYYHASRFYYLSTDRVWSLIYGEMFVNMEPQHSNSAEIKQILLDGYKKFFTADTKEKGRRKMQGFAARFSETLRKQAPIAARGINPETLTMIRARFILDWKPSTHPPVRLFEHQQQLMREGLFDAYNQWLFGPAHNLQAYQQWITTHKEPYEAFRQLQQSQVFKVPQGQYLPKYNVARLKN